jgi:hypothetical protein
LLVKPTNFATNAETLTDNTFVVEMNETPEELTKTAISEFDKFVDEMKAKDIDVKVFDQAHKEALDSVFPNNWFSTHHDEDFPEGLLIIYPVKSPLRRLEKSPEIISYLKGLYKDFIDLSYLEAENEFLESTGCLIFDFQGKKIYCSVSERATAKAINTFAEEFNKRSKNPYKLITFSA